MQLILPPFLRDASAPLYLQLYRYIRSGILDGAIPGGEKMPSLRSLSAALGISVTTVTMAYDQLAVEGYLSSRPGSGYYVNRIASGMGSPLPVRSASPDEETPQKPLFFYDPATFDFARWKKCTNRILTDRSHLLLSESNPQGEFSLRKEIARHVYQSRGVSTVPSRIVIGAGIQQLTGQLSFLLQKLNFRRVILEDPCYLPVRNLFRDRGFALHPVPVDREGIRLPLFPPGSAAAYVSPSNQFPTGAVIPIGKRYQLLRWAAETGSYIIEDDYDSELRYFGKPIPALQGLDTAGRVIYLGSFSSTLFPAVKISYMVLPEAPSRVFDEIRDEYTQTCSKLEQLALAVFMETGQYQTGIRKIRTLFSQKLQAASAVLALRRNRFVRIAGSPSGLNMVLEVRTGKTAERLCREAASLRIRTAPLPRFGETAPADSVFLVLFYNQIPLDTLPSALEQLLRLWQKIPEDDIL